MKRALELAALLAVLCSGSAIADEPGFGESESPVITPVENSGNSLPVLAEARRPPADVPASRAARAEWQRRIEQRQLERQRRDEESTQVDPALRNKGDDSRKAPARRNRKSRGKTEIKKPSPKKRADADTSMKTGSKKPDAKKRSQVKPTPDKTDSKTKPDGGRPAVDTAKKDSDSDLPLIVPQAVRIPSYAAVRGTIPFSRSEWEADPTYRHNATMELMLGQLRDMVVYRYPSMGGPMAPGSGVTINNGGGSQNPQYGYGGFGGIPFGFNPGLNGVIPSRGIINSFQTQGFIGRSPLPAVPPSP